MSDEAITQEEIQEAMSLLSGDSVTIEPARKKVVRHNGKMVEVEEAAYVKFSTRFKEELADMNEYALKVFLYIGLSIGFESGSAHPGVRKIAEETGMAQNTVIKAVRELEEKGFLTVLRREKSSNVYTPVRYISIGKSASPDEADEKKLPQEDANLPHENENLPHDSRVNLHNQINKKEQETSSLTGLSEEDYKQANQKVDMILAMNKKGLGMWKGREFFNDNVLHFADWYFNSTGQVPTAKTKKSWVKAFSEWTDEGLALDDLEEARRTRIAWKKFIADPNELTKDASAIKAQKSIAPEAKTNQGTGFYA